MAYSYTGTVRLSSGTLNLRSAASETASVLTSIPNSASLTVVTCGAQAWFKTSYGGYTGYVSAQYIEILSGWAIAVVQGGTLNLRQTASTTAARLAQLPSSTVVTVLHETSGDWVRISAANKTGWVLSEFLYYG